MNNNKEQRYPAIAIFVIGCCILLWSIFGLHYTSVQSKWNESCVELISNHTDAIKAHTEAVKSLTELNQRLADRVAWLEEDIKSLKRNKK